MLAHVPLVPDAARRQLESAAHVVMRARLGDVTAKQFIRTIASAAKAGVQSAQHIADSLIDGSKLVAKTIDVPAAIASQIPGLGSVIHAISPFEKFESMATALQRGDFGALKKMAESELQAAQGFASMVPGVGSGVSAAIGAGLAVLEGGSSLEIAIRAGYGAIPIPIGVRQITDAALDAVLELARHPHNLTDAAVAAARDRVPSGLARDVFDTLIQIVVRRVPVQKAGASLVDHYVRQYAGAGEGLHLGDVLAHAIPSARMLQPLHVH